MEFVLPKLCRCARPVKFETPLFKGGAVFWINHTPTTSSDVFRGVKRKSVTVIQGRFQRPVCMDDLITGEEFGRPLAYLPPKWLVQNVLVRVGGLQYLTQPGSRITCSNCMRCLVGAHHAHVFLVGVPTMHMFVLVGVPPMHLLVGSQ